IAAFKALNKVRVINAFGAALKGSFLKSHEKLQNVEDINIGFNPIAAENLQYLSKLPKLKALCLTDSTLDDNGLRYLTGLSNLQSLQLAGMRKITDKSVPVLAHMTGLLSLDVRNSSISFNGICALKNLKLTSICLPPHSYPPQELATIRKLFPKTLLSFAGTVGDETKSYFAPIK
ncbi:MAG: hypothetical protein KGS72_25275, partial [Cyanobacteria bacterium REEB67]|nr:hypothetical protein [Cyanobacteria bacterium REEB67]